MIFCLKNNNLYLLLLEEKNCHSKLDENQKMFDLVTHILMLIFDKEEQ